MPKTRVSEQKGQMAVAKARYGDKPRSGKSPAKPKVKVKPILGKARIGVRATVGW
jgi:hypothetical protein